MSYFSTLSQNIPAPTLEKLKQIKLVVFDVDGTISDGSIILDQNGNEFKRFYCQDGLGITLLHKAGLEVALLTGRTSELTSRRAAELKIKHVLQGFMNKEEPLLNLVKSLNLSTDQLAVMGDDINDIPMFHHAAVSACPADAYHYMTTIADIILTNKGGRGAVREFSDLILMAQGYLTEEGLPASMQKEAFDFRTVVQ